MTSHIQNVEKIACWRQPYLRYIQWKTGVLIGMIFLYLQDVLEEQVPHWISNRHCGGSGAFAHYIPRGDNSFGTEVPKKPCQTTTGGRNRIIRAAKIQKRGRPQQWHCCHSGKKSALDYIFRGAFFNYFDQIFAHYWPPTYPVDICEGPPFLLWEKIWYFQHNIPISSCWRSYRMTP